MAKSKRHKKKKKGKKAHRRSVHTGGLYLEYSGHSQIAADNLEKFRRHLDLELAIQREKIIDYLQSALSDKRKPLKFSEWVRIVPTRFASDPLSTVGSVKGVGGRFNFGKIDDAQFTPFDCLYIASDRNTGLSEYLQRDPNEVEKGITAGELNLLPENPSCFGVSGNLQHVVDLTNEKNLSGFLNLIKKFKISDAVMQMADELKIPRPKVITTLEDLMGQLLDPNFKYFSNFLNVPSNSQWFGQICHSAGIEGILYPSVRAIGQCLALFPDNFLDCDSFVELTDAPASVVTRKLEGRTIEPSPI
ncbi:MAG: RES domain-containing protein [Bradymonadales bacterium]|nr:MAG: RES domain-containing protein [Bradymonadales bacterium]